MDFRYIKRNGEVLFLDALASCGDNWSCKIQYKPEEIKFPAFRSWAGLNGWIATAREHFNLDIRIIEIAIRSPEEDFSWLLGLNMDNYGPEFLRYSPFGQDPSLNQKRLWYEVFSGVMTFKTFSHNYDNTWNTVQEWKDCSFIKRLTENHFTLKEVNEKLPNWRKLQWAEIRAQLFNVPVELAKKADISPLLETRVLHSEIDPKYWDGKATYASLLKGGVRPVKLAPALGLSQAEAVQYCTVYKDCEFRTNWPAHDFTRAASLRHPEVPSDWHQYMTSLEVLDWAARHMPQLQKMTVAHGPAGQTAQVYNHLLLRHITVDMLTQGAKTAWRKIEQALKEVVKKQLEDQLGVDRPLPICKLGDAPKITQITTTNTLKEEGLKLSHCVGGYISALDTQRCYIYHVDDGTQLGATVEITPSPWRIQQCRGLKNADAPGAQKLVEAWLSKAK